MKLIIGDGTIVDICCSRLSLWIYKCAGQWLTMSWNIKHFMNAVCLFMYMCVYVCIVSNVCVCQVLTREAAHPDVIPMGTWCKLGKQMPTVLVLLRGCCGTSKVPRLLSMTPGWMVLLQVISSAPGGFACTRLKCLSSAQESQWWFTG